MKGNKLSTFAYGASIFGMVLALGACNAQISGNIEGKINIPAKVAVVSTLAGTDEAGFADGPGTSAFFMRPSGVAVDKDGNVYVTDRGNHRIRRITPAGAVSTLAGTGDADYLDNIIGTLAKFNYPTEVAVDKDGNVYVADEFNHRIRRITKDGAVSTLAGTGEAGFADGPGTSAFFVRPSGVAVDKDGNVYVADTYNHRIRMITPAGAVSTLAGTGDADYLDNNIGTLAKFKFPNGVAVDKDGNVYVADEFNHRIRKITFE